MKRSLAERLAQSEAKLQTQVMEYLASVLPADAVALVIPAGDRRVTTAPGYVAGAPDLHITYRGRSIFIELKKLTGRTGLTQVAMHQRLTCAGALVAICRTLAEVEAFLGQIIPLKGAIAA